MVKGNQVAFNGNQLGVGSGHNLAYLVTLSRLGINRGGFGDGEGLGVGLPSQAVGAVRDGCTGSCAGQGDFLAVHELGAIGGRELGSSKNFNDLATQSHVDLGKATVATGATDGEDNLIGRAGPVGALKGAHVAGDGIVAVTATIGESDTCDGIGTRSRDGYRTTTIHAN